MKSAKLPIALILMLIVVGIYYKYSLNVSMSGNPEVVSLTIEPGQGVGLISTALEEKNLIRSPLVFKIYVQVHNLKNSLQAGDYEIPGDANTKEIIQLFQHGTFDARLTIIEGWRVEEIADYLATISPGLSFSGVDFLESARLYEGQLFPDTYLIPRYVSADDLVSLMVSNFNQKVGQDIRAGIENTGLSLEEATILASIVEREAPDSATRPIVAGILLKRLENEWPLQADATVQYAIGYQTETNPDSGEIQSSWWKAGLTKADLEIDSPYNTRRHPGLPPTPISNPGIESIKAVANPKKTEYWYYLSDKEGKMHYAVTLEDHNENIARYLY